MCKLTHTIISFVSHETDTMLISRPIYITQLDGWSIYRLWQSVLLYMRQLLSCLALFGISLLFILIHDGPSLYGVRTTRYQWIAWIGKRLEPRRNKRSDDGVEARHNRRGTVADRFIVADKHIYAVSANVRLFLAIVYLQRPPGQAIVVGGERSALLRRQIVSSFSVSLSFWNSCPVFAVPV